MKQILVCEDDGALISMIRFKLQKDKIGEVTMAQDGREAIDLLKEKEYDMIISDIHMPYHSGLELLTYIRNDLGRNTPFIILSAEGLEKTVMQAFNLGVSDFLTKPFSPNELSMRVSRLIPE